MKLNNKGIIFLASIVSFILMLIKIHGLLDLFFMLLLSVLIGAILVGMKYLYFYIKDFYKNNIKG